MQLTGNTILVTGGGSGIGRGLAESLHKLGNKVIIAGRRQGALDETTGANPGIVSMNLNVNDSDAIRAFADRSQRNRSRFHWRSAPKQPTRNTVARKRAGQEDVDFDYLFGNFLRLSFFRVTTRPTQTGWSEPIARNSFASLFGHTLPKWTPFCATTPRCWLI
jgi:NAD(P)-dependent dehydrogenase (short-subunit alcohol dehydrogenase family)